jgi:hypothetical protein
MTTRTIQLLGLAYGSDPATITVTAGGETVFTGSVPTIDEPVPPLANPSLLTDQVVFCSFERDANLASTTMTYSVSNGTVIFGLASANYMQIINPVYSPEQVTQLTDPTLSRAERNAIYVAVANPPLTEGELATLADPDVPQATKDAIVQEHNCALQISSGNTQIVYGTDPRSNVYLDGTPLVPNRGERIGTWWWAVVDGSTLTCDFQILPSQP